ncbi:unnamed protein product [Lactuca virosa]|uniref:Uncharacterized protein n=1 Tax=Lactuca virosa TaxID=75947 RepID=A0AAU9NJX4_9ASTR|nr:unnamed protein product [Lactuca virosa]
MTYWRLGVPKNRSPILYDQPTSERKKNAERNQHWEKRHCETYGDDDDDDNDHDHQQPPDFHKFSFNGILLIKE